MRERSSRGGYDTDWKVMSQAMDSIRSPSESVAREFMEHSAFRAKYFVEDANKVHQGENSSKSPQ